MEGTTNELVFTIPSAYLVVSSMTTVSLVMTILLIVVMQLTMMGYRFRRSRGVEGSLLQEVDGLLGEVGGLRAVAPCQEGLYPPMASIYLFSYFSRDRLLVVASSYVFLFDCRRIPPRVGEQILKVDPERVRFLGTMLLWGRVEVSGRKLWIHRRFRSEVLQSLNRQQ
jgi:hypothetical protein